jgi:ADP-ribose pyrophosphatase
MKTAAARELKEETGFEAKRLTPLLSYYPSYGCGNQEFHIFLGENIVHRPELFDPNEVLEVKWFPESEVKEMIRAGNMVDGLSLTPLLHLFAGMKP